MELVPLGIYTKEFASQIAPSAGLRNVLVHEYDEVDDKLIYTSMKRALEQYPKYCAAVLRFLEVQGA